LLRIDITVLIMVIAGLACDATNEILGCRFTLMSDAPIKTTLIKHN